MVFLTTIGPRSRLIGVALATWLYTAVIVNRWAFTEEGTRSFGRVWMFYVSWTDLGFVRRSLFGTILTVTGANQFVNNEYVFVHLLALALLTLCLVLIFVEFLRSEELNEEGWLSAAVFLSPAFTLHLAYATGSLDPVIVILFLIGAIYVRRFTWLVLLTILGVLTHEASIFLMPAMLVCYIMREHRDISAARKVVTLCAVALSALFALIQWGQLSISESKLEKILRQRIPEAAGEHRLWSGYFELSSTTADNANVVADLVGQIGDNWVRVSIPILYVAVLIVVIWRHLPLGGKGRAGAVVVSGLPLMIAGLADDFYRWLSLAGIAALTMIMVATRHLHMRTPPRTMALLALFSVFAPFGSSGLDRPFPVHQEILEGLSRFLS